MKHNTSLKSGFGTFSLLIITAVLVLVGVVGFVLLQKPVNYGNVKDSTLINQTEDSDMTVQPTLSPETDTSTLEMELKNTTVNSVDAEFNEMNASASSL